MKIACLSHCQAAWTSVEKSPRKLQAICLQSEYCDGGKQLRVSGSLAEFHHVHLPWSLSLCCKHKFIFKVTIIEWLYEG